VTARPEIRVPVQLVGEALFGKFLGFQGFPIMDDQVFARSGNVDVVFVPVRSAQQVLADAYRQLIDVSRSEQASHFAPQNLAHRDRTPVLKEERAR
jgi:hypothetical protein